jgi:lipoic acid synthetase
VTEFVHPDMFDSYAGMARQLGFLYVASGPLVRSSYKAGELFLEGMIRGTTPTAHV